MNFQFLFFKYVFNDLGERITFHFKLLWPLYVIHSMDRKNQKVDTLQAIPHSQHLFLDYI